LVRTEDTGALHPDDFWIRNLLWKPILREHFFEEIDPQLLMTNRKKAENLEQLAKIKADRKKGKK
jgi:hypothetical protein